MSFRINDLVIHLEVNIPTCPPGLTCMTTQITGLQVLEEVLGAKDPAVETICNKINAQIVEDPTQEDLKILAENLQAALDAVKSKIE